MIQEVQNYEKVLQNLNNLMNKSHYKKSYFIKKLGLPTSTFYRKLKNLEFNIEETKTIVRILEEEKNIVNI